MKTKGKVERMIVNYMVKKDRRYKHDLKPETAKTDSLASNHAVSNNCDKSVAFSSVRRALGTLREKGLIKKVWNQRKRKSWRNWIYAGWKLTEEGIKEAKELRKAYREEAIDLLKKYGKLFKASKLSS